MLQIFLYTLSNLFDSTHFIELTCWCINDNLSIVDWFNTVLLFVKDLYLILQDVNFF